ncbi:alpha-L-fucosidase [Sphingobacterium paludis]|uniref:alpha-L-fucosidase n=1 Tax=Sphingobacterium paludis TaxID=1476465 RepID=A0A4R7D9G6_9SPHI|nr:alpha-L-fucosidase [Sphingobacterium paludis]TDS17387.1 alpha-L-fucosidase [Sphingobacterium paludis]
MRRGLAITVQLLCASFYVLHAQDKSAQDKMAWFEDAKLGIFIHWGIYAVDGISESWAFFNNYVSHDRYLKQLDGFTATKYNPQEWVDLVKTSGAKYAVITAKHHDGVALWNSQASEALTIKTHAAAKKDVLSPFIEKLKRTGMKTGIYFSLPDWSHPYYDVHTRIRKRYEIAADPKRWDRFVHYYQQQLQELSNAYRPDLLWFDGDWEHSSYEWDAPGTLQLLRRYNPNIIVNSRLNHHGDYETPEQGVPVVKPGSAHWELCYTMNDSWGYQPFDRHYKTPNMIVRTLIDCIAMGGNLLLDVGPKADGTLPKEQVAILQELGRWTKKHGEAVYGTRAGLHNGQLREKNSFSKDGRTLYIYLDNKRERYCLPHVLTPVKDVRLIGSQSPLTFSQEAGRLMVTLPPDAFDPVASVLAIAFDDSPQFAPADRGAPYSIAALLQESDVQMAVERIAASSDAGDNIFADKLTADGSFLTPELNAADTALKQWIEKHAEVLSFTREGLPPGHYAGYSALSNDRKTLYLFVNGQPSGPIALKGLNNTIARIRIVGEGSMLSHQVFNKLYWSVIPGIVYIDIPKERLDKKMTVIAVLLDKPVDLYREKVGAIENNL